MDFNRPDVYIQDISTGASPVQQASSTIGVLIGAMKSGPVGEAVLVSSWTEFIQNFANGLETPFMKDSDLPYSVYGFFANGGSSVYIIRVASDTVAKAKIAGTLNAGLSFEAKYPGAVAPVVQIKKNADWTENTNEVFDVVVTMSSSDEGSATISEVTKDTIVEAINTNMTVQNWIVASADTKTFTKLVEETLTLTDGADGIEDLVDNDFIEALEICSTLDDASFLAIPGQTSTAINDGILTYCDAHMLFPILDMPIGSTVKATKEYRKSISAYGGCLAYPWGNVSDPLTNGTKTVPSAGHVMGVYSRVIGQQGIKKAPAGVDAVVKGFLSLEKKLTDAEIGQLNPVGVICIVPRTNAGIVVWGARGLNPKADMRYVTDVIINYNIKKSLYAGTQFAVFEPNDETLWSRVTATCEDFLENLRLNGVLKGEASEAYYVKCDATNNTDATINNGFLYVEIGYAPVKPAEFVVIKLAHSMSSES
jgi:phage tail sheath protein FI